jgi:hypothetical protein
MFKIYKYHTNGEQLQIIQIEIFRSNENYNSLLLFPTLVKTRVNPVFDITDR